MNDRTDVRPFTPSIIDGEARHSRDDGVHEPVVNRFRDNQARRGRAPLAGREERALDGDVGRQVDVGVVNDDERVLAAHLELTLGQPCRTCLRDRVAGGNRSCKADPGDTAIVDEDRSDLRPASHDEVERAGRQAGAADNLRQRPGAARRRVRWLEHDRVPVGQGRGDLPGRDRDRKIPGRDERDHANRLARDVHRHAGPHRGDQLAGGPQRLAGEELEDLAGAADFTARLGRRLALFTRQQIAKLGLTRQDFRADAIEGVRALLRRR